MGNAWGCQDPTKKCNKLHQETSQKVEGHVRYRRKRSRIAHAFPAPIFPFKVGGGVIFYLGFTFPLQIQPHPQDIPLSLIENLSSGGCRCLYRTIEHPLHDFVIRIWARVLYEKRFQVVLNFLHANSLEDFAIEDFSIVERERRRGMLTWGWMSMVCWRWKRERERDNRDTHVRLWF